MRFLLVPVVSIIGHKSPRTQESAEELPIPVRQGKSNIKPNSNNLLKSLKLLSRFSAVLNGVGTAYSDNSDAPMNQNTQRFLKALLYVHGGSTIGATLFAGLNEGVMEDGIKQALREAVFSGVFWGVPHLLTRRFLENRDEEKKTTPSQATENRDEEKKTTPSQVNPADESEDSDTSAGGGDQVQVVEVEVMSENAAPFSEGGDQVGVIQVDQVESEDAAPPAGGERGEGDQGRGHATENRDEEKKTTSSQVNPADESEDADISAGGEGGLSIPVAGTQAKWADALLPLDQKQTTPSQVNPAELREVESNKLIQRYGDLLLELQKQDLSGEGKIASVDSQMNMARLNADQERFFRSIEDEQVRNDLEERVFNSERLREYFEQFGDSEEKFPIVYAQQELFEIADKIKDFARMSQEEQAAALALNDRYLEDLEYTYTRARKMRQGIEGLDRAGFIDSGTVLDRLLASYQVSPAELPEFKRVKLIQRALNRLEGVQKRNPSLLLGEGKIDFADAQMKVKDAQMKLARLDALRKI